MVPGPWAVLEAGLGRLAGGAAGGGPLASNDSTLFFAQATPDSGVLVGVERELQAVLHTRAGRAYLLGGVDLVDRQPRGTNGKEQRRVGVLARRM